MTLSEFIAKLQTFEALGYGELPVALADWQEQYRAPSVEHAEKISFAGDCICIGDDFTEDSELQEENPYSPPRRKITYDSCGVNVKEEEENP